MDIDSPHPEESDEILKENVWRDGPYLVLRRKKTQLPDRCILCNAPAEGKRLSFRVRDPHAILEQANVKVGLCPYHRSREVWAQLRGWILMLAGLGMLALADLLRTNGIPYLETFAACVGVLLIIAGGVYRRVRPKLLTAKRIERQFVWLENIHPDYLAEFRDVAIEFES